VFYYLTYEGAVDLESTQETTTTFHRPTTTFAKVNPKTTFERFNLTDDEVGKPYSIYSEDFPNQNRHFERFFPDEAEYFPNTSMMFLKLFTQNSVSAFISKYCIVVFA
jgi:hypothetical protein